MRSDDVPRCTPLVPRVTLSYRIYSGGFSRRWMNRTLLLKGSAMLHYAVVFLVIALIAAVFGFGGIAASAAGIAKILFVIFLIGAVVAFLMNGRGTRI